MITQSKLIGEWFTKQVTAHGKGGAMARLRHKIAIAVYYMLKHEIVFDEYAFLGIEQSRTVTPEIVYATSIDCSNDSCFSAGSTVISKVVDGFPQPPEPVFEDGSYYGGAFLRQPLSGHRLARRTRCFHTRLRRVFRYTASGTYHAC